MSNSPSSGRINLSISQIDQVTQQNSALVEEAAAAADDLNELAHTLSQAVAVFNLGDTPTTQTLARSTRTIEGAVLENATIWGNRRLMENDGYTP